MLKDRAFNRTGGRAVPHDIAVVFGHIPDFDTVFSITVPVERVIGAFTCQAAIGSRARVVDKIGLRTAGPGLALIKQAVQVHVTVIASVLDRLIFAAGCMYRTRPCIAGSICPPGVGLKAQQVGGIVIRVAMTAQRQRATQDNSVVELIALILRRRASDGRVPAILPKDRLTRR